MLTEDRKIWIATGEKPVYLLPGMANRHGLIAGATGTGKTTTLKVLAESFSDLGVPVFLADIKGDLGSLALPGTDNPKVAERVEKMGIQGFSFRPYPVAFWDLYGEAGTPVRTTVSDMGALLLARLLNLNETQTGILNIVFRIADERGLLLIDLKDLKAMIQYVGDHAKEYTLQYGNITSASVGAILRNLLTLEDQAAELFFGEPALDIYDWLKTDVDGRGVINILHGVKLVNSPALYSTFLLWMLSELFETLPESGDLEKPKIVFFFDEAHLLFNNAPKILISKIEEVVRLIRSKGVGVYFITQNPADLTNGVLGQLGNRVQHALRGFTPADQKQIKAAAETFRPNPSFDTAGAIMELATGEALVSCLDEAGRPNMVERAFILPPQSLFGVVDEATRAAILRSSTLDGKYRRTVDPVSAYETLAAEAEQAARQAELAQAALARQKEAVEAQKSSGNQGARRSTRMTPFEKATSAAVSTIGRELGRTLIRGILGSIRR